MILHNTKVHLAVPYHGEDRLGRNLRDLAVVPEAEILEVELLLVDGRRRKERCIYAFFEPLRSEVAGVADLPGVLDLMTGAMCLPVAEGNVTADLLSVLQLIGAGNLAIANAGPAGVQP